MPKYVAIILMFLGLGGVLFFRKPYQAKSPSRSTATDSKIRKAP